MLYLPAQLILGSQSVHQDTEKGKETMVTREHRTETGNKAGHCHTWHTNNVAGTGLPLILTTIFSLKITTYTLFTDEVTHLSNIL